MAYEQSWSIGPAAVWLGDMGYHSASSSLSFFLGLALWAQTWKVVMRAKGPYEKHLEKCQGFENEKFSAGIAARIQKESGGRQCFCGRSREINTPKFSPHFFTNYGKLWEIAMHLVNLTLRFIWCFLNKGLLIIRSN